MVNSEHVAQFGVLEYYWQHYTSLFWWYLRRNKIYRATTRQDQQLDNVASFDEYPNCGLCGCDTVKDVFTTISGSSIVQCTKCNVLFTSPRIVESVWIDYLKTPSKRNVIFTENRIKYGVALPSNTRYSKPDWFSKKIEQKARVIEHIEKHLIGSLDYLHDVGCGVGFQIMVAEMMGIVSSGNDLNGYAVDVMNNRIGLTVYNKELPDTPIIDSSLDALIMNDYIEHTYHPRRELEKAYSLLRPNGVIYIHTFHIDCKSFVEKREKWHFLFWNHTYHFNAKTLIQVLTSIGYEICQVDALYEKDTMTIIAKKPIETVEERREL